MKRASFIIIPALFVAGLLFFASKWWEVAPAPEEKKPFETKGSAPTQEIAEPSTAQAAPPPNPNATPEEGRIATEKVSKMISAFHTRMKENPVGTNAEITKALLGGNPVHATFSQEAPSLNAKGELLDPWGTPYFFHQISGDVMEIRSAGPDKIMGTADDIIEN